jgi:hypothetical protein
VLVLSPIAPLALWVYHERRKVHARRLQDVVAALHGKEGDESLWRSLATRVWEGHRLEMHSGATHACTTCHPYIRLRTPDPTGPELTLTRAGLSSNPLLPTNYPHAHSHASAGQSGLRQCCLALVLRVKLRARAS